MQTDASQSQIPLSRHAPLPCRACDLNAVCRLIGLISYEGGRVTRGAGGLRTIRTGAALYRAGAPAQALFALRQGTVKLSRITTDDDERIVSFHIPGDVLGLEAFGAETYAYDAIALEPVQCCELALPALTERTPKTMELAAELVHLLSRAVGPQVEFSRGSARERVTKFLLDLSQRSGARGFDPAQLRLSMSRFEIANLLDTRIETVSRTLQQLNREQAIHVRGSHVEILSLAATGGSDAATTHAAA